MALISCPECGKQISTNATTCPHCGNPLKTAPNTTSSTNKPVKYAHTTKRVTCWGLGGNNKIVEQLQPEISAGWEIVSVVEDHWRGGILRHVYTVTLKKLMR